MRRGGPLRVAVLASLAVPLLAGCSLLGFPPYLVDEEFPEPSGLATYTAGSATITLDDGTVIDLDEVGRHSTLNTVTGTSVRWRSPDGWSLGLQGVAGDEAWGSFEMLQLDRIFDGNHWTTWDTGSCDIDMEHADEKRVAGTATCNGLTWMDALEQPTFDMPEPLDEPEFDAEITFEATSEGTSTSG